MKSPHPIHLRPAVLALMLWSAACAPFFTNGFPRLELFFELGESIVRNDTYVAYTGHFPGRIELKNRMLRVSGRLQADTPPSQIKVEAELRDAESDKLLQKIRLNVKIRPDGTFEAKKKLRRPFEADSLLTVALSPGGADLAAGTEVTLCVDLLESKEMARTTPSCGAASEPPDPRFAEIQETVFTPSCTTGGCHDSGGAQEGLVLEAGRSYDLLVGVPSSQKPELARVEPGLPDASYLVQKIRGDAGIVGHRMPPAPLPADRIALIEEWVADGARP